MARQTTSTGPTLPAMSRRCQASAARSRRLRRSAWRRSVARRRRRDAAAMRRMSGLGRDRSRIARRSPSPRLRAAATLALRERVLPHRLNPHSCAPPAAPRGRGGRWRRNSGVSRMSSVRSRGRSLSMTSWMRPGRGDMTTMRVERNTASGIEWVTKITVFSRLRPELQQLLVQMVADDLVERAERLVHQEQRRVEGERAGDRGALLHAAGELPGKFPLEAGEVDQREVRSRRARPAPPRGTPMTSSGSATLRGDGAPGIERRRLEDVAVARVLPRLLRRSCR